MPIIRPLKGLRYNTEAVGNISEVVAPPYDIIFEEWRDKLYTRNSHNIIRLIKSKEQPGDTDAENKYTRAADSINSWIRDGVLKFDDKPSVYVCSDTYTAKGETKTRYGFVSLVRIEEYGKAIYPHERTLSGPKADRLKLVTETKTNLSQIFSIYRDQDKEIQAILMKIVESAPEIDFVDEQEINRKLWIVQDTEIISALQALLKDRDIIIADGHHRYETAMNYKAQMESQRKYDDEPFDYVSMYLSSADDQGLTIFPTHRKVSGFENFDAITFFNELKEYFDIEYVGQLELEDVLEQISPDSDNTNIFGIYTADGYRIARFRKPSSPKELDVDILHNLIIEKLLGISRDDIANGRYIHFCKSPEHAIEDVKTGNDQVSFMMNAIKSEEMFLKVLKGVRMPQKSTYFYPKTLSGLVMYKIGSESL